MANTPYLRDDDRRGRLQRARRGDQAGASRTSTTSSCWNAATASAEPGVTPAIPAPAVTSRRCCTRTRSSRTRRWSRTYSPADEIRQHLEDMATRFDIRRRIQFGQEVTGLSFDDSAGVWTATTATGKRFRARTVVLASGPLPDSSFPDIRGIDSYRGHKIHSARWDHDYDFTGKRVAVIGTGASAIQIIPELVKQADFVKVFQRTPGWVLPRWDVATPPAVQAVFAKAPAVQQLARQALFWGHEASATALVWNTPLTSLVARLGRLHLRRQVKDPWLRRQLHPRLHSGLQTHAGFQRLLPRPAARQLQAHRLADRDVEPGRDPHQRRHRTPSGLHRVRHRLRRASDRSAVPGHRARRTRRWAPNGPTAHRLTRAPARTGIRTCSS